MNRDRSESVTACGQAQEHRRDRRDPAARAARRAHPTWPFYRDRRVAVDAREIELAPLPTAHELALRR